MSTKYLVFVLGTILLVQCALSYVTGKESDSEKFTSPDAVGEYFGHFLLRSFYLIDKTFNFSRTILEPAVASVTITKNVTKTPLQKNFEELKEYLQKSNNLVADDERKNKIAFLQGINKILDDIKETEKTTSNFSVFERTVLQDVERFMAVENFRIRTYKRLGIAIAHIVADAEDYWEKMDPKKRQEKQKFHETILQLKNETDSEKKAELIGVLIESGNE